MNVLNKEDLKPQELDHITKGQLRRCTMCKFVLIFAFAVLLLVLIFAFFFRQKTAAPVQIPIQTTRPIGHVEMDQHTADLKGTSNTSSKVLAPRATNPGVKPGL